MRKPGRTHSNDQHVFLNIPFDQKYEPLFVAFIAGISGLGLTPRCVLEVPAENRLDRLFRLLKSCGSSIHDLSRVEFTPDPPRCPRFNMPFELGLAVALTLSGTPHRWFVFEAHPHRLQKSLSDVNGFDPYIHYGRPEGVLQALLNAFMTTGTHPRRDKVRKLYENLQEAAEVLKRESPGETLFTPYHFPTLVMTSLGGAAELGLIH